MSCREWAEAQLAELELLSSMFPTHEELEIVDQLALAELRDYADAEGSSPASTDGPPVSPPTSRPQFVIKQRLEDDTGVAEGVEFILSCTYPPEYPSVVPEITVRCSGLSRGQQTQLHAGLNAHLADACPGEVCVLSAVEWLKENLRAYVDKSSSAPPPPLTDAASPLRRQAFSRLWIYSHHIYNSTKRKNILEWAKELGLSGFSMPGKPGIVCVEGDQEACEEFWSRLKALTWKRITIRHREDVPRHDVPSGPSVDSLRKFCGFEEAAFDPCGNHMDLGLLYQFLREKGCGDVFQMYFGVEGRG
ncbi:RWD domain-containing protein 2B [Syngnathoides biaculeatus]|uniref:RWD domain-containing protein 2B n=1 Tax=Syngnathoides biaculeatus TaxID=300417 RepID=UPI002ADD7147|nr:RWD domain-containing protein 2B [Syngnathoides biaculeatus]XP_061682865.1 RWD domain-containing protein 2B [Syngnathoides biaculeatus]